MNYILLSFNLHVKKMYKILHLHLFIYNFTFVITWGTVSMCRI
jgi:hypothetical protein